jgi:capsular exopolysaccharide synthesis family protein
VDSKIRDITSQIKSYQGDAAGLAHLRSTLSAYQVTYQTLLISAAQSQVGRSSTLNAVNLYSSAVVPSAPISPHPGRDALLAGFVVLLLAIGGIRLYAYLDDSIKSPEEAEAIAGAPVLGTVEHFDPSRLKSSLIAAEQPQSVAVEGYRLIRTNIQFTSIDNPPKTLLITSTRPGEGKSTTASNLAYVLAESDHTVTLVDADLRRPNLHRIFGTDRQRGLTSMLMIEQMDGAGTCPTKLDNLTLLVSGPIPPRPTDLLASQRMRNFVERLRARSEFVVLDTPALLAAVDAAVLATMADGVILVVDPTKTKRGELRRSCAMIEEVKGKILGIVINRLSTRHSYQYGYTRYEYASNWEDASSRPNVRSAYREPEA